MGRHASPVSTATADPRLAALLARVTGRTKIDYRRSRSEHWGSVVRSERTVITYVPCLNPASALCHELLHVELQLDGYRRIKIGFSAKFSTPELGPLFRTLLTCLDNELQHHKIYPRFVKLGFPGESFFCDADVAAESYLRDGLSRPVGSLMEIIPDFFTLIAPGGCISPQTKSELLESFYSLNGGQYRDPLKSIFDTVNEWASNDSLDNAAVYKQIMLAIQPTPNLTWFGFDESDSPPHQGFFVDQEFEIVQP